METDLIIALDKSVTFENDGFKLIHNELSLQDYDGTIGIYGTIHKKRLEINQVSGENMQIGSNTLIFKKESDNIELMLSNQNTSSPFISIKDKLNKLKITPTDTTIQNKDSISRIEAGLTHISKKNIKDYDKSWGINKRFSKIRAKIDPTGIKLPYYFRNKNNINNNDFANFICGNQDYWSNSDGNLFVVYQYKVELGLYLCHVSRVHKVFSARQ